METEKEKAVSREAYLAPLLDVCEAGYIDNEEDKDVFAKIRERKIDKMLHYAKRTLTDFVQYDAFINLKEPDFIIMPDDDNDCILSTYTEELMNSPVGVRLLIVPGTEKEDVLRVLKKMIGFIESGPEQFAIQEPSPLPRQICRCGY